MRVESGKENLPERKSDLNNSGNFRVKLRGVRRIGITGEYIRLDALLKFTSVALTGGEAKIMIQNGEVFIGGHVCAQRGKKIRSGDVVRVGNEVLIVK